MKSAVLDGKRCDDNAHHPFDPQLQATIDAMDSALVSIINGQ
jgi:hypothetical protein